MSNTFNNKFYKCNNCKINLCRLCYSKHNKEHNIINYDSKDIICNIHKEVFISYCNECKINICLSCINNHKGHDCISFQNILPDIDKIKLNKVSENMEIYYRIYNDILNNYENKNRNYELIKSINEINNINIIKDIKEINNDENINDKCCNILNIYNKMINNKINEKKEKIYKNGKYIGSLKNGLREGKGIMYYNNGNRYEGNFKNDKMEGKGIYYFNNGNRYEGDFKNDKAEGKGIYYYNNGQWKGDRYEGDYKNDKREGKGIFYFNDGSRYEGDWKNDKKEGKGIFYYNNGDREMGDYSLGKKIGKHVTLHSNGNVTTKNY